MSPASQHRRTLVLFQHATGLGGAELNLLQLLAFARQQGMRVLLVYDERGALCERFVAASDTSVRIPFPYPGKPASWLRLPRLVREVRRSLAAEQGRQILVSGDFLSLWSALFHRSGTRRAVSLWQGEYDFEDDHCVRKWLRYGAARADLLLASEPIARHANATGLLSSQVQVLNPFVDDGRFDPSSHDRAALRAQFGWAEGAHVAICVGRIGAGKGQLWLAEEFSRSAGFPAQARLVLVGPAEFNDEKTLRSVAAQSGGRLQLLGTRQDIPELLAAADLAIQPGRLQESFGLAAVEAALMRLPLLAFRVGALPFTMGENYPGLVDLSHTNELMVRWRALAQDKKPDWNCEALRQDLVMRFGRQAWERQASAALK